LTGARHEQQGRDDGRRRVGRRIVGWLGWALWALAMAMFGLAVALELRNRPVSHDGFLQAFLVPGFATVGAVVAARRRNTIGWLFLGVAMVAAVGAFSAEYAVRALVTAPGSLPAGRFAAWLTTWVFIVNFPALGLLLVLFPDGRPPSRRWRQVAWGLWLSLGGWVVWSMLRPQPIDLAGRKLANPFGIQALHLPDLVETPLAALKLIVVVATLFAAALAPFWRRRRAGAVERQQLKWLAFITVGVAVSFVVSAALLAVLPALSSVVFFVMLALVSGGIPVAVGLAVLRYRLYDIDRLITRALVYGTLTVLLALAYALGTVGLGQVLGRDRPSVVVAGVTLACAAMFQPARRRVQNLVDRRFNRRRYDAAKTIEAFATRLRDSIDLDTLSVELLSVIDQTMEPTRVSLWLRPDARASQDHDDPSAHRRVSRPTGASRSALSGL